MAGASRHERAWVRGARAGRAVDVEALFRHHWPLAYRAAYLVVHDATAAEDIAQEAFLAALRSLHRFDRRRPFGPWLHRIVVNRAIDHARSRALRREVAGTPPDGAIVPPAPVDDALLAALACAVALAVVAATPPGEAIGHWVKRLVAPERSKPVPRPALTSVPGSGRLLVAGPGGVWVVNGNGSRRRLGPYQDASWSPHGLF